MASHHFGPWHFGKWHIDTEISSQGHFVTWILWLCRHTGTWKFHLHGPTQGLFSMDTIWYKEFLAPWTFQQGIFWYMDVLAPHKAICTFWNRHFGTDISAPVLLWQNVHVPKCAWAERSMVPKNPWARRLAGVKRACVEKSWWLNVYVEISLAEMLGTDIVESHIYVLSKVLTGESN